MTIAYVVALLVGSVWLLISATLGHDHEGGHDGLHAHDAHVSDTALSFFPFLSIRFWVVLAAFFGFVGTVLSATGKPSNRYVVFGIALGIGYLIAIGIVWALRRIERTEVTSGVSQKDLQGCSAEVIVGFGVGGHGKIRARVKDRTIDLLAQSEGTETFSNGQQVLIYAIRGNSVLIQSEGPSQGETGERFV